MERENISVDIITVHGHEHVVVINGMAFELDPGMFDPTIHKIEWVAGQGVIYWEDGRENTLFGKDGYDVHIAPVVRAFGEEQRRVEDNVIILDAERRQRTYATAKQRANLLSQIREVGGGKWPVPRRQSLRRSSPEKFPRVKTCTISFPTIPENWNSGRSSLRWMRICNRLAPARR